MFILIIFFLLQGCSQKENITTKEQPKWIKVVAVFTNDFVNNYQYEDSKWYMFALNINGNYYNVFRKHNNWVGNSIKHWLTWAVPAYKFNNYVERKIPFGQINIAKAKWEYWYKHYQFKKKKLSEYKIKLSPVKENVKTHNMFIWYYY